MARYICIHGHFYQPPRENPYFDAVEVQDSAYPYHDWNERVAAECYAPNATARILDGSGRITNILNNYSRISFNFGPTLLAWMERHDPETYAAVLEADQQSRTRFSGHGSALAQVYNHLIMPLAKRRDQVTQVLWGLADFRRRFGREAEGMWLPETAVNLETLSVLAEHGLRFTILAPHQAARVRRLGETHWHDVSGARIDTTRPYLVLLPEGRHLAVFFYNGPTSRAVAFEQLLTNGEAFVRRLLAGFSENPGWDQLVHIATDGETYGHHHRFGEMALAWSLHHLETTRHARLTNYGEFLAIHPPAFEVEILDNTSWSCAHGIERWRSHCGCASGAHPDWSQAWRGPLRHALDWLRDELAAIFEQQGGDLLLDPWAARDTYVDAILDRSLATVDAFLSRHAHRPLTPTDETNTLKLLEMQRHAMLMYTSCGWFFDEISGIEATQVLQYAGRAVQLAEELTGRRLETTFLELLAKAPSNVPAFGNGAEVFIRRVKPAAADLNKVGAHSAISSLFGSGGNGLLSHGFHLQRPDHRTAQAGRARLAVGRLEITSEVTRESALLTYGVLHLGDHNLTGGVREGQSEEAYRALVSEVMSAFSRADLPATLRALDHHLELTYSLKSLFKDEQRRILAQILDSTLDEAAAAYRQVYEKQAPLMRFLSDLGTPLPQELHATAEFVLNAGLRRAFREDPLPLEQIHDLLGEASLFHVVLDGPGLSFVLRGTLHRLATRLAAQPGEFRTLQDLTAAVGLATTLPFEVDFWKIQNAYFRLPAEVVSSQREAAKGGDVPSQEWITCHEVLGTLLHVLPPPTQGRGERAEGRA
jgi:alpha-amylase/alpha-mannosidase (GH57 family)